MDKKRVRLDNGAMFVIEEAYEFKYDYLFTDRDPAMTFELSSIEKGVDLSTLFTEKIDSAKSNNSIKLYGDGQFHAKLKWDPNSNDPFFQALQADFLIEGRGLKIYGIDLDNIIEKYKRSQEFNLADVGAVMFAGPAGLAVRYL